ncbi:hypothetical protein ABT263_21070 [Kitasatospora sp. NPDC001603]|uniref:hypothetical protein n=1 Tax=Kitasatospora sp. NPDC001603 TaxID=3154388 RepID=UPI0033206720
MSTLPSPPAGPPATDPTKVGTALVLAVFGVERLSAIPGWHDDEDSPLGRSADEIHRTARRLDHVQQSMVSLASTIRRDMQRVVNGDDVDLPQTHGLLGSSALSLDLLCARRAELHQHLDALTQLHKILSANRPPATPVQPEGPAAARTAEAPQRPAKLNEAQRKALDAVARGRVHLQAGSVRSSARVTTSEPVSAVSVTALIKRKLVEADTRTSLYQGQKLRLTAAGTRLHAAVVGAASRQASPAAAASPEAPAPMAGIDQVPRAGR